LSDHEFYMHSSILSIPLWIIDLWSLDNNGMDTFLKYKFEV